MTMLPLYEAKMIHHYETRWATYEPDGSTRYVTPVEKAGDFEPLPRYWVAAPEVERAFVAVPQAARLFAWRGIARTTDARTAIGCLVPRLPGGGNFDFVLGLTQSTYASFAAHFLSFVFDYCVRQKLSNMHLQFSVAKQLPMPTPAQVEGCPIAFASGVRDWIGERVDRLNARPNGRNDDGRAWWRAELDALAAHLFGLRRDELDYVLDTFPIVARQDVAAHGEFRTKRLILQAFDAMTFARDTGTVYDSDLARMAVTS